MNLNSNRIFLIQILIGPQQNYKQNSILSIHFYVNHTPKFNIDKYKIIYNIYSKNSYEL